MRLAKTSPHAAYYIFTASVKHELTYLQKIGVEEEVVKETEIVFKFFVESLVGQTILDNRIHDQISNPTRYGGLAINTNRLAEESKELFMRGETTTSDLEHKLITQDQSLPARQFRLQKRDGAGSQKKNPTSNRKRTKRSGKEKARGVWAQRHKRVDKCDAH